MSDERRENERGWQSLPVEEQIRIYDALDAARKRLNAPIETTRSRRLSPEARSAEMKRRAAKCKKRSEARATPLRSRLWAWAAAR
jgi:hypothetical protein